MLGDKFFFLSGCPHHFCRECVTELVQLKLQENNIQDLKCSVEDCQMPLNDHDIKKLGLDTDSLKQWEKLALHQAID